MTSPIERINALTQNAKSTWFALLSALLFVGVTLMGVEHIDFYGVDRATQLPLINVSVPTPLFFYGAPLLIAAIYSYFHLYLIRLWDALGAAPSRHEGTRLGEAIAPWLVSDAALHLRARLRGDNCAAPRALESASMLLNILLAWVFGPFVLAWLWWASMPARTWEMTTIAGVCLLTALIAGSASLAMLLLRMKSMAPEPYKNLWSTFPAIAFLIGTAPLIFALSLQKTTGPAKHITRVNLAENTLTQMPQDWVPFALEFSIFQESWCKNRGLICDELNFRSLQDLEKSWKVFRRAKIQKAIPPRLSEVPPQEIRTQNDRATAHNRNFSINLSNLNALSSVFVAANLSKSYLKNSNLSGVIAEGAFLRGSQIVRTPLLYGQLQNADLDFVEVSHSDWRYLAFQGSRARNASFTDTDFQKADFTFSDLQGTVFLDTNLSQSTFLGSNLSYTKFRNSNLNSVKFDNSKLERVDFRSSEINYSIFTNSAHPKTLPRRAVFSGADFDGSAFRNINLQYVYMDSNTVFQNTFLDKTVSIRPEWLKANGTPCQWRLDKELPEEEFYARWKGWIHRGTLQGLPTDFEWEKVAPMKYWDVTPIPPDSPTCRWKDVKSVGRY
ncbi:pentapeptide protein [Roseobacter sp. SK209-2-6]|uniref:pentapeptide repeat-containing protein n=1 Tax=Roseobacter sp. SK209-2-6 TaxID=388739 RepID=UPI0000F3F4D0|nr:pentapeptide repeat-containing protein [Roseobacter sp. SK209-2-6]EBA14265.1 pentapeptide protein [Roseobacter sp. SK209-2-6]